MAKRTERPEQSKPEAWHTAPGARPDRADTRRERTFQVTTSNGTSKNVSPRYGGRGGTKPLDALTA